MLDWLAPDVDLEPTATDYRAFRTELVAMTDLTEDDLERIREMDLEAFDGTTFERGKRHDAVNVKLLQLAEELAQRRDSLPEDEPDLREPLDERIDSLLAKDSLRLTSEQTETLQGVAESLEAQD